MTNSIHSRAFERGNGIALVAAFCYNTRMNMQLKVTKIGNSAGVILPKEFLDADGAGNFCGGSDWSYGRAVDSLPSSSRGRG